MAGRPQSGFNTQPPEGGWRNCTKTRWSCLRFQHTAARRRLDDWLCAGFRVLVVSTHSRPKAAGQVWDSYLRGDVVSTHSRPKAAGTGRFQSVLLKRSFNTQPPEGGWMQFLDTVLPPRWFQHTAARRRLGIVVSMFYNHQSFNTQPPEGGWSLSQKPCSIRFLSPDFAKLSRKARMRV